MGNYPGMGAEGQPAESLLNEVAQLMIIELTEGREATSATHSAFVTLAEKWVAEKGAQGVRRIASPAENRESFKNFAKWMVITAERERSFTTTIGGRRRVGRGRWRMVAGGDAGRLSGSFAPGGPHPTDVDVGF